jgi:acyl-CoA thioester hydrolase
MLAAMAVTYETPVAWGDMDAFRHVNNTVYLRWFESARIALFAEAGLADPDANGGVGPILARSEIDYRVPLYFPDRVRATAHVVRVGTTSFVIAYRVTNEAGVVAAEGQTVIVMMNYRTHEKVAIDADLRRRIEAIGAA